MWRSIRANVRPVVPPCLRAGVGIHRGVVVEGGRGLSFGSAELKKVQNPTLHFAGAKGRTRHTASHPVTQSRATRVGHPERHSSSRFAVIPKDDSVDPGGSAGSSSTSGHGRLHGRSFTPQVSHTRTSIVWLAGSADGFGAAFLMGVAGVANLAWYAVSRLQRSSTDSGRAACSP